MYCKITGVAFLFYVLFNYWVKGVKGRSAGLACREIPSKMIVNTNACEKVSLCNP